MRLYHRRSSVYRDRLVLSACNPNLRVNGCSSLQVTAVGSPGPPETPRERSHSLFLGSNNNMNLLNLPMPRSRSNSFSGVQMSRTTMSALANLTNKEEDYVFKCYARAMYFILGLTAAMLIVVVFHTVQAIFQS